MGFEEAPVFPTAKQLIDSSPTLPAPFRFHTDPSGTFVQYQANEVVRTDGSTFQAPLSGRKKLSGWGLVNAPTFRYVTKMRSSANNPAEGL